MIQNHVSEEILQKYATCVTKHAENLWIVLGIVLEASTTAVPISSSVQQIYFDPH